MEGMVICTHSPVAEEVGTGESPWSSAARQPSSKPMRDPVSKGKEKHMKREKNKIKTKSK